MPYHRFKPIIFLEELMKSAFAVLALIILSTSAFAQRRGGDDEVVLRDGRRIIRIDVGDDRDERDMLRRVRRLEQAVRDLQEQVYQLQAAPVRTTSHVCSATVFSIGMVIGRGPTQTEARASAMQECERRGGSIFCRPDELRCEQSQQ